MEECDGGDVTDQREVRDTGTARVIACRRGEEYGCTGSQQPRRCGGGSNSASRLVLGPCVFVPAGQPLVGGLCDA